MDFVDKPVASNLADCSGFIIVGPAQSVVLAVISDPHNLDTIPEAPRGIHKRYCNLSRTVWENAGKTNETLAGMFL